MNRAITGAALALGLVVGSAAVGEPVTIKAHNGWVGAVAFAPDGKTLASGGADGAIKLWDPASGNLRQTWAAHKDRITALAFAPDGKSLASGGLDRAVRLWDPARPSRPQELGAHAGGVTALAFSANGKLLASGGLDGETTLWDPAAGVKAATIKRHTSWVNSVAFSRDGQLLTGSSDNYAQVWHLKDNKWSLKVQAEATEGEIRSVAFAADNHTIAVGVRYGVVRAWDLRKPPRRVAHLTGLPGDVWAVAFSPDGKLLACGAGDWDRPGEVRLYDAVTWKLSRVLPHSGEVLCVAFSPDGRRLAAGAWDGSVRVWDLEAPPAKK